MKRGWVVLFIVVALVLGSFSVLSANCGGVTACSCGDTLNESWTMSSDLSCTSTGLTVGAHNVVLDCAGNSVTGNGSTSTLINFEAYDNLSIKNCVVSNASNGIYLGESVNSSIINNTVSQILSPGISLYLVNSSTILNNSVTQQRKATGISLESAKDITVDSNNLTNASLRVIYFDQDTYLYDYNPLFFSHNITTTNTLGDKPIVYIANAQHQTINQGSQLGQLYVINSTNITLQGASFQPSYDFPLLIYASNTISLDNLSFAHSNYSASVISSINVTITNSSFEFIGQDKDSFPSYTKGSLYVYSTNQSTFESNLFTNGSFGITLNTSHQNTLYQNSISNFSYYGLKSVGGDSHNFSTNTILDNAYGFNASKNSWNSAYGDLLFGGDTCSHSFDNNVGTGQRQILATSDTLNLGDSNNVSQIILCGVNNANVSNVLLEGQNPYPNTRFDIYNSQIVRITNVTSTNNAMAMYIGESSSISVYNSTFSNSIDKGILFSGITSQINFSNNSFVNNSQFALNFSNNISDSQFISNHFSNHNSSVVLSNFCYPDSWYIEFMHNNFYSNRVSSINARSCSKMYIYNNSFHGTHSAGAILANTTVNVTLNTINATSTALDLSTQAVVDHNTILSGSVTLGSSAKVENNQFNGSSVNTAIQVGTNSDIHNNVIVNYSIAMNVATLVDITNNTISNSQSTDILGCPLGQFGQNYGTGGGEILILDTSNVSFTLSDNFNLAQLLVCSSQDGIIKSIGFNATTVPIGNYLRLSGASNISLSNLSFTTNFTYGIHINQSPNTSVYNTTISNATTGIYIKESSDTRVENSNITYYRSNGIFLSQSDKIVLLNNSISNALRTAVYLDRSDDASLINNTLNLNSIGFQFFRSNAPNLDSNTITNHNSSAVVFNYDSENAVSSRNYFRNTTTAYVINSITSFTNSTFDEERIINHSIGLRHDAGTIYDLYFYDSFFINNSKDIEASSTSNDNITFVNSTINLISSTISGQLKAFNKHYIDVYVNDTLGSIISDAQVQLLDSLSSVADSQATDLAGETRLTFTEFFQYDGVSYYLTPHTIIVTKANYTKNTSNLNLVGVNYYQYNTTLQAITCGMNVTTSFVLGGDFYCNNTAFRIKSENVEIDGSDYSIVGNNSNPAIVLENASNLHMFNLSILDASIGVDFKNTNHTRLDSVDIDQTQIAIRFNQSHNNTIYDSIITNTTQSQVSSVGTINMNNSMVNSTFNLSNSSFTVSSNLFKKWYTTVNVTFNSGSPLLGANVAGYFSSPITGLDDSSSTNTNGIAQLTLSQSKINSSQELDLSLHEINVTYTGAGSTYTNTTGMVSINSNNVYNLSFNLDCTVPSTDLVISSDTTLCPGSFTSNSINITSANTVVTCSQTSFTPQTEQVVMRVKANNVSIINCSYSSGNAVDINGYHNATLQGLSLSNSGIDVVNAKDTKITNTSFTQGNWILFLDNSNRTIVNTTTFSDASIALVLRNSHEGIFNNNTFDANAISVYIWEQYSQESTNNIFFHNQFDDSTSHFSSGTSSNHFNKTVTIGASQYIQGNTWDDYCDKGSDNNADGYADAASVSGNDYPYNSSTSSKISGNVTDYHPKVQDCVTQVFLGGSSSGGGSASSSSGGGGAPATSEAGQQQGSTSGSSSGGSGSKVFYDSATQVSKNVQKKFTTIKKDEKTLEVKVTLTNTGDKHMKLAPKLLQNSDDPFYIVKTKTLGTQNSRFSRIAGIWYSSNPIAGRLLEARLLGAGEFELAPGETRDFVLELEQGFSLARQVKIQFTYLGDVAFEEEVSVEEKDRVSGTAVDVDKDNNNLDIYAIIVPTGLIGTSGSSGNSITGAAVSDLESSSDEYYIEINLNSVDGITSSFADFYGPYAIRENQPFVFAQQIAYDEKVYSGQYVVATKIYQGSDVVVENEFEVSLE